MQKVPPYVFIAVTGYTLGASSDRSSRRRRCWHSDRHNNSQIPLQSPETQTRKLHCASRQFGTRSSYVWGSYSLLWLPTGTVLSANGDTILGFLCTRCTPTVGVGQVLMRAGCEDDPLVLRFGVCGAIHPLANTGKPSWWCFHFLKPSGHYIYHQFNIQQLYILPTQCIYVFCVDLRTNSDYFPIPH